MYTSNQYYNLWNVNSFEKINNDFCLYSIYMDVIIKQLSILYISWFDNDLRL